MDNHKGNSVEHQKQQALNVARTNDESVVSKRSAARAGYFEDRFLPHFVRKPSKRAALINRGYYIRREAVMLAVQHFLALHGRECQIVSLGAGFDTLFFVLASQDRHPRRFYEMDFDHVVKNKRTLIEGTEELTALVGADAVISGDTNEIESSRYALLCGDLCQSAAVKSRLTQHGLSYSLPTMFLAECVFTYMPNEDSDRLIFWAATAPFPACCFVTYEQVRPYDAFGRTMRENLKARGSDLLGIEGYPSVEAQCARYSKLGFKKVCVRTMLELYWDHLPAQERERIEALEEFDEHEEWLEKCSHYILAVASTVAGEPMPFGTAERAEPVYPVCETEWKDAVVKVSGRSVELKRWGHSVCVTGDDRLVVFGGYGGGARHERLNSVVVMHKDVITLPSVTGVAPSPRVLHAACMLSGDRMLVHGGRAGPGTPLSDAFVLECRTMQWKKLDVSLGFLACYRHSLTAIEGDAKRAIGFGGKTGWRRGEESNSLWLVSPDDRVWRMIPFAGDARPPARASHAACWHRGALYVHGGLGAEHRVLSDMWRLEFDANFSSCRAELVAETGVARFSHSIVAVDEHTLLLLGGHNHTLQNNIAVFDSASNVVRGIVPAPEGWSRSRFVPVDNRIVSVGGGMLCFSFGSAFCGDEVVVHTFSRRLVPEAVSVLVSAEASVASIPKAIAGARAIQRLHGATPAQFRDILSRVREPVLFSGSNVPRWTREDILAAVSSDTLASIHVCESALLDFANKNFRFEVVPFAEMLSRIDDPNAHLYFRSLGANARKDPSSVPETFPNLAKQFMVPDFAKDIVVPESTHSSCLRFSSQNVQMWTHYDINDNLLCGIRGRKRLILFHPEDIRYLYPDGTASAVLDVETPDLVKFPRFAKAVKWEGILEEGDVLFIPAMWWHNVRTLTPCYGLNVFFRHLPEASYQSNDLYGNKDPHLAVAAEKAVKQAVASLSNLPEEYKRFFARKLIMQMKTDLL